MSLLDSILKFYSPQHILEGAQGWWNMSQNLLPTGIARNIIDTQLNEIQAKQPQIPDGPYRHYFDAPRVPAYPYPPMREELPYEPF